MLKFILLASVVCLAVAKPQVPGPEFYSTILRSDSENYGDGNFRYGYETSNGIKADATGFIKNPTARAEDQIQVIQGSYSYIGPDGITYTVSYIADENGFQPYGAHLPQNVAAGLPVRNPGRPGRPF